MSEKPTRRALNATWGALRELSPCEAPECKQIQTETLANAIRLVEEALASPVAPVVEPQSRAQVVRDVLEGVIKVCEAYALQIGDEYYSTSSKGCANAFRALLQWNESQAAPVQPLGVLHQTPDGRVFRSFPATDAVQAPSEALELATALESNSATEYDRWRAAHLLRCQYAHPQAPSEAASQGTEAVAKQDYTGWVVRIGNEVIGHFLFPSADFSTEALAKTYAARVNAELLGGVSAYGCGKEAKGGAKCMRWCGLNVCPIAAPATPSAVWDMTAPGTPSEDMPAEVFEWFQHLELHLTEHDEAHAGRALRSAWPAVRDYFLTCLGAAGKPKRRADGCRHTVQRMMEWIDDGACPICAVAAAGMRRDKLHQTALVLQEVLNYGEQGLMIDEHLRNRIEQCLP